MFEHMEIAKYVYKGVVETYYKKPTQEYANQDGHIRNKRGAYALYKTHHVTGESSDKC